MNDEQVTISNQLKNKESYWTMKWKASDRHGASRLQCQYLEGRAREPL